jgi:hypothetical protein
MVEPAFKHLGLWYTTLVRRAGGCPLLNNTIIIMPIQYEKKREEKK